MINLKVLSTAAALALVLPLAAAPTASFAQNHGRGGGGGGHMGGGGGGAYAAAAVAYGRRRHAHGRPARVGGGGMLGAARVGGGSLHVARSPSGRRRAAMPAAAIAAAMVIIMAAAASCRARLPAQLVGGALASGAYGYYGPGYAMTTITTTGIMMAAPWRSSRLRSKAMAQPTACSDIAPTIPLPEPISVMTACGIPARNPADRELDSRTAHSGAPSFLVAPQDRAASTTPAEGEDQRGDLAEAERLVQGDRGGHHADHRHRHGADRRDRGRQPRQRRKPAHIGDAELDHRRVEQQIPAELRDRGEIGGLEREADQRDRKAADADLPGRRRQSAANAAAASWPARCRSAKPIAPPSAIMIPGSFDRLAATPLPPMMAASPANAITSATTRSRFGRSPRIGQASSDAHTGMV